MTIPQILDTGNTTLTLGENLSDNIGLKIVYPSETNIVVFALRGFFFCFLVAF